MSKNDFTPGPWYVAGITPAFHVLGGNPQEIVADANCGRNRPATDLANARLIAAAPDLKNALVLLLAAYCKLDLWGGDDATTRAERDALISQARAAIAKAQS